MEQSVSVRARVWVPFNKFSPLQTNGLQGTFLSKSVNVGQEPENGKLFLEYLRPQGLVADNDMGRDIQSRLSVAAFRTNGSLGSKITLVSEMSNLLRRNICLPFVGTQCHIAWKTTMIMGMKISKTKSKWLGDRKRARGIASKNIVQTTSKGIRRFLGAR